MTHLMRSCRGLRVPFDGANMSELKARVTSGQFRPIVPGRYSPELVGLVTSLLSLNPARRPPLLTIFALPQCQARLAALPPSQLSILPPAVMKTIQVRIRQFGTSSLCALTPRCSPILSSEISSNQGSGVGTTDADFASSSAHGCDDPYPFSGGTVISSWLRVQVPADLQLLNAYLPPAAYDA